MTIPEFRLDGKVAMVTGGRRGIGRTIALAFAEAGADIAICDQVTEDGHLEGVAEEIRTLGRRAFAVQADTSRRADVRRMVAEAMAQFGSIDILVNNAGILIRALLLELDEESWDKIMGVDLKGYFLCSQEVGKRMVQQKKGNIINISTQFAFKTDLGFGAYSVAKVGVVMMTRVLARELGPHSIRVNGIAPGLVITEFSRPTWSNPETLKQIEASLPLGRVAEASDLVGAALFLASDASNYVTGHTILMDGGALA
ncbi:MAG: 3-oxoacyl-ACP reductase FabG [Proteobacteria bacterium]|nr:3-oxoacyl-ACP reductase FabG [Pseudomonadota bacterium]